MTRHIVFSRLHNFRDLGGYHTHDGRSVRWGWLYRSDSLGKLHGEDWERFLALGVGTVIDLRYPWEIERAGRVPESDGLDYHNLSVEHRPYRQEALGADVELGRFLAGKYAEVAADGVAELRRALEVIASAGDAPVVFHCASGKDRTGLLAALILSLLGVSEDDVVADFALTELATEGLVADWLAENGRLPRWPGFGRAPAEIMRLFLVGLAAEHGSVHGYARDRLGVDEELINTLKKRLLI
ncbi:tyrosine-protein phosphatase [Rhizohabitans arisaemae]|uniref:tyrosine-protein phosphatase n=1 Tax=Rhizohabitans arisaemae TaxID=2720610 RepID=UPI0024B093A0|nr:tyrosine-protein phosphatase [Rhizohabitans arisaemae]